MLVLFETPAGYAIFKLLDEKKLEKTKNLYKSFETPEKAARIVKLKHFEKFLDTSEALAATTATVEGKVSKKLKSVIKRHIDKDLQEKLLVADAKLGSAIKNKFSVQCVANTAVQELMRCIRSQLDSLLSELPKKDMTAMTLGLAHSLSRYKLKFSPDKIDTMIVQAVSLLGDLDKEINNYVMRLREWYGWHFPELGKLVPDHLTFAKLIKIIGTKEHTASADLSDILPEEVEEQVKEAAEISMGSEISDYDILMIQRLCDEIIENINYRGNLFAYIQGRMMAIAPNVTVLVGELVGARLMAHAGSLVNLAKRAASTIQILGAEKALFRALKTRNNTPKYGIIYHAELVGQSTERNKGRMSRMLAAKVALATRVDALGEDGTFTLGVDHRAKLEVKLRELESGVSRRISGTGKAKAKFEKYHGKSEVMQYRAAADSTLPSTSGTRPSTSGTQPSGGKRKRSESGTPRRDDDKEIEETPKQKKKRLKRELREAEQRAGTSGITAGPSGATPGPSGVKASPSPVKIEEVRAGPSGVKSRPSGVKARPLPVIEEVKARPSGVKPRLSEVKAGPSGVKPKPSRTKMEEVKAGPSGVKPKPSEVKAGPSGVKPRSSGIEMEGVKAGVKSSRFKVQVESSGVISKPSGVKMKDSERTPKKKKDKHILDHSTQEVIEGETEEPTLSTKKKKKIKQVLERSETSIEEIEQPTSSKKKKVKSQLETSVEATEIEPEPRTPKKKKKKVRHELETEVETTKVLEPEPSVQQSTPTSPKKKKKKVRQEGESETSFVAIEEPEVPTSSKKKKKTRPDVESETSFVAIEEPEVPTSSKKKKKTRPDVESETSFMAIEEPEEPTSSKKKKKKKIRQEVGEPSSATEEREAPVSEKKQKKKKKREYTSDSD